MPNPFALAGASSTTDVKVDDMFVFGDSYSVARHNGVKSWASRLVDDDKVVTRTVNYAVSAATAFDRATNDLDQQIRTFEADGRTIGPGDLTVLYFGYNDVNNGVNIANALTDFRQGASKLISAGAGGDDGRLFVTLIHDWSRNSGIPASQHDDVIEWNNGVASYANSRDDVVAVDLFTVFERIYNDPSAYGFTNVETADPANSGSTALYNDSNHFGARGQTIIAQVFEHYLTRGWDWSNTLRAGSAATSRLNRDIDNGLILGLDAASTTGALSLFPVGTPSSLAPAQDTENFRAGFTQAWSAPASGSGIGIDYALGERNSLGLVLSRYGEQTDSDWRGIDSDSALDSEGLSFYLRQQFGSWQLRSLASYADNDIRTRSHDSLAGSNVAAATTGESFSFSQRISRPTRSGGAWFTPWLDLAYMRQTIDSYTIANPYLSDTTFGSGMAEDLIATVGLGVQLDPVALGGLGMLTLDGGLTYRHGLYQPDYEVDITEVAFGGLSDRQRLARQATRETQLRIGGEWALAESMALRTEMGLGFDPASGSNSDIRMRFDYRF